MAIAGLNSLRIARQRALAVVCVVLFLTFLDNTVVSVVLAGVQADLSAGVQALQWIINGYMLAFAALMLSGGTLGDILGRKKVMLSGVGLFLVGSAIAMLATSPGILTVGRVVMGVGAAASEPGTLSMIRHLFPQRQARARALGVWAAVSSIALAFGPVVGGLIIGFSNWRGVFVFNLVVGAVAFILGIKLLPESADPRGRRLDIVGLVLGAAAMALASFAIIQGESSGYKTWWIDVLFAVSLLTLGLFIAWERRAKDPALELKFFRKPAFSGANFVAFATNFGLFAIFFFTALFLSIVAGFSGYDIAIAFIAMSAAMVLSTLLAGRWVSKRGPAGPMIVGCFLAGIGVFIVEVVLKPDVGTAMLAWPLALAGFGFGMTMVSATATVLSVVPARRSGMAASSFNMFRELGGVFGVAVLGAIMNGQLTQQLVRKLVALGLPHDFQSLVIYAITHGGNLPANSHVSAGAVLAHPQLVGQVTDAAYQAFGDGLSICLKLAGALLLLSGVVAVFTMRGPALARHRQEYL
ncbi:MAG TPA: MFS transporter [Candidatus Saccharimonadales bacterium]|nr:MFS transporter [Candidatus Saccharimonadales bacterium]